MWVNGRCGSFFSFFFLISLALNKAEPGTFRTNNKTARTRERERNKYQIAQNAPSGRRRMAGYDFVSLRSTLSQCQTENQAAATGAYESCPDAFYTYFGFANCCWKMINKSSRAPCVCVCVVSAFVWRTRRSYNEVDARYVHYYKSWRRCNHCHKLHEYKWNEIYQSTWCESVTSGLIVSSSFAFVHSEFEITTIQYGNLEENDGGIIMMIPFRSHDDKIWRNCMCVYTT